MPAIAYTRPVTNNSALILSLTMNAGAETGTVAHVIITGY